MIGGPYYGGKGLLRLGFDGVGVWRLFKWVRGQNLNLNPVSNQIGIIFLVFVPVDAAPIFEMHEIGICYHMLYEGNSYWDVFFLFSILCVYDMQWLIKGKIWCCRCLKEPDITRRLW